MLFIQSRVPEHAELHLLLSMVTPLGWLERVPTYKDQQEKLSDRDLSTYGFLGYPLLQAADILMYRAAWVPVGEDQVPHVEFTREIARRFNHLFGREPGFEDKAREAVKKLGSKRAKLYQELRTRYQEQGDDTALQQGRELLELAQNLSMGDRERLFGYLEGSRRIILAEPQALLTEASRMPGIDGQKMSKSYGNSIAMREDPESVRKKIARCPPTRRACAAPTGRARALPGVAAAPRLFRRRDPRVGADRLPQRRHRLPRMQAAGDRRDPGRAAGLFTSGRSPTSTTRACCATSSPTAATRRARSPGDDARGPRGDGARVRLRPRPGSSRLGLPPGYQAAPRRESRTRCIWRSVGSASMNSRSCANGSGSAISDPCTWWQSSERSLRSSAAVSTPSAIACRPSFAAIVVIAWTMAALPRSAGRSFTNV